MSRVVVVGAGAWGTALAVALNARGGHAVTLWGHRAERVAAMRGSRENAAYLPGVALAESIEITSELEDAVAAAEIVLLVTPSDALRATVQRMAGALTAEKIIVSAAKGVEDGTTLRMTEVIADVLGEKAARVAVLSGPSFAQEVAAGMPTAITIAAAEIALAQHLQREFSSKTLRLYANEDVTGVELGGALKNVIAISAGVVTGLGLGHNSQAALITRGIAEMTRLATACGGRRETLAGLAGIGDLVLTCTGSLSRNRTVGVELGRGRKLMEILAGLNGKVAEGVRTTTAALGLAKKHSVEMPITEQMAMILHEDKSPKDAIRDLMSRPGRDED